MTGTTSGTARARPRGLVWRKRNANFRPEEHEAHMRQRNLGEQAKEVRSPMSFGRLFCICDGCMEGKSVRNTRGDLLSCPKGPVLLRGGAMKGQKSAEGIVAHPIMSEGPNLTSRKGAHELDGYRRRRHDG